jgi:predicted MPP superfamily phosphohydrolase
MMSDCMRMLNGTGALRRWLSAGMVVLCSVALWALYMEPASLRNDTYELTLPRWPAACDGIRVAVLADLHEGSPFNGLDKLDYIVARTQAARPDLILLAGDYVIHGVLGGTFIDPETMVPLLRRLSAPMGVVAVLGNHDHWFNPTVVRRALESAGIPVLEDAAMPVGTDACRLWVAGISDLWTAAHDVSKALASVPSDATVVALTHNPDVFADMPERVVLTIAGHTHGGQVYIPFIGRPVVPSRYGQRYAIGHVIENGRHLFVSSGLGTSILPIRFLVPPEISVLRMRAAPTAEPG